MKHFHFYCLLVFLLFTTSAFGQSISFTNPDFFSTCNDAEFKVDITNNTASSFESVTVQFNFPCEIEYVAGSINGATEGNISDLVHPIFNLANIAAGSTVTLTYMAHAPCAVNACVDAGQLFNYSLDLDYTGGQLHNVSSGDFDMETSLLVFTQVDAPILHGVKGQTIFRTFTVRNTRPGAVKSFTFTDSHSPGLVIQTNVGTDISVSNNEFKLSLSGTDFTNIGDGDELFEQDEELVIIEEIFIDICGQEQISVISNINLDWGCDAQICANFDFTAIIYVDLNTQVGDILAFDSVVVQPTCYCSSQPLRESLTITNISSLNDASNINIVFDPLLSGLSFLNRNVKLVANGDTTEITTNFDKISDAACIPSESSYSIMDFIIPSIPANESVTVFWDIEVCNTEMCNNNGVSWSYTGSYFKNCTLPTDTYHLIGQHSIMPTTLVSGAIEALPLEDNQLQTIKYHVGSLYLDSLSGTMKLAIELPCGMSIQNPVDWSFAGVAASNVDIAANGDNTLIDLTYPLPLPDSSGFVAIPVLFVKDTVCYPDIPTPKDSLLTSCSMVCVGQTGCEKTSSGAVINASVTLALDSACAPICHPQDCNIFTTTFAGSTSGVCIDTVPGYAAYTFDFFRTTYGQADNDNNHEPDGAGAIDLNAIRTDRAVYGDSLHADIQGVVITDLPNISFPYGYIAFRINPDSSFGIQPSLKAAELKKLLDPVTGFQNFDTHLRIFDKSANTYYSCPIVPDGNAPILEGLTLRYYYDISPLSLIAAGGNVPQNYTYEKGDSILFEGDYRINYNFDNGSAFGFHSLLLSPTIFLSENPFPAPEDKFACNCQVEKLQIANITYFTQNGFSSSVDICGGTTLNGGVLLPFYYGVFPNFFPYEYRKTATLNQLKMPKIEGLKLKESFIEFATLNGQYILDYPDSTVVPFGSILIEPISFPNEDQEGFYIYDLSDFPDLFWDDNVYIRMKFNYENLGCKFTGLNNYQGQLSSDLVPQNNAYHTLIDSSIFIRLRGKHPSLNIDFELCDKLELSDSISWQLSINNTLNQSCSNPLVSDAPNLWLAPSTANGLVDDYHLFDQSTGLEIPSQNGIFALDSLKQCDTIRLLLTATNHDCSTASVLFNYGWSCTPYTDPIETPCASFEKSCQVTSPPGVIDIVPDTMPLAADLCEDMPFSYIEVFDAGLGAVFDVTLNAQLPPGLIINTGTSEIEWPTGSGNFSPTTDPIDMGNGLFQWNITDALDTLKHGLPGINSAPANSATIRFKTLTTCDFISGSFIIYAASAKKVCSLPTNNIAKLGAPLNISSVSAPYSTALTIGSNGQPGCSDSLTINVNLSFSDTTGSGDGLFAQLPLNTSYVPGSCAGNFPNCEPTISGNELSWILPQGVASANISFKIIGFVGQECQSVAIPFYATTQANVLCVGSNQNCNIKIQTGAQATTVNIVKPTFTINSFIAHPVAGNNQLVDLEIGIQNVGILNEQPITAKLYYDNDGDGSLSTGDSFIQSFSFNEFLNNGDATVLTIFAQAISPSDACKLMIVIGEPENCVCATTTLNIQAPILYPSSQIDTVCSGEMITIGQPAIAGHNYQWETNNAIACLTCSETSFTQVNETFNPITHHLILKDNADCLVNFEYTVTVLPKPRIWSADEQVCQGNIATLVASDGGTYQWQGEGITDPTQQIQMVSPMSTGLYTVTITNEIGCQNIDSVTVMVLSNPIADAGNDVSICRGKTAQLAANVDAGLDITWTPGFPKLDNPNISNPNILTDENTTFTLTVSNGNCVASDDVQVNFFDGVGLTISQDTAICLGDTATIIVQGADSYTWTPNLPGMCQNTDCSIVLVAPTSSLHLTVKGTTTEGCTDTIGVQVTIIEDTLVTNSAMNICNGSSIVLFGQTVNTAGTYCDTIEHAAGCYEVKCITVSLLDSIMVMDSAQICAGSSYLLGNQELTESGVYCTDTISSTGCDSMYCLNLLVLPNPSISITPDEGFIKIGDSLQLEVTGNFTTVIWSPNEAISCIECVNPIVSPSQTTWYYVQAIDANGCQSIDSILVSVQSLCDLDIEIPNAFTPNNDGINDFFRIVNLSPNLSNVQIDIFSRWGQKVFSGKGNSGWDGKYKGKELPADAYVYLIVLDCEADEKKMLKGDVILLR